MLMLMRLAGLYENAGEWIFTIHLMRHQVVNNQAYNYGEISFRYSVVSNRKDL